VFLIGRAHAAGRRLESPPSVGPHSGPSVLGHGKALCRERLGWVLGSCSLGELGGCGGCSVLCTVLPLPGEAVRRREGAELSVSVTGLQITTAA